MLLGECKSFSTFFKVLLGHQIIGQQTLFAKSNLSNDISIN